jgi:beta-glucosidase
LWKKKKKKMEDFVDRVLAAMSLEEKLGQMTQLSGDAALDPDSPVRDLVARGHCGSLLHVTNHEQLVALEKLSPTVAGVRIAPLFCLDAVHGHALAGTTASLPSQLCIGCSFSPALAQRYVFFFVFFFFSSTSNLKN